MTPIEGLLKQAGERPDGLAFIAGNDSWSYRRLAVEAHHCIATPIVAGQNHEILARKYVNRARRVHVEQSNSVRMNPDVGYQRTCESACDDTDCSLHRLLGPNKARRTASFQCELLDERHVQIGADTERE